ncbi:hypothetical protein [Streptomyces alboflavus]|uniref:hypothetical protein n=1 Tax=Streptomyces alboflavus TaxID=67267 RepID=UPI0036CF95B0
MKIIVHDTASSMLDLLRRPLGERPDVLRDMLGPLHGVMSTVGVDVVQMHQMGSGFRIDVEDPRYLTALCRMRDAGVWGQIEDCLPGHGAARARHPRERRHIEQRLSRDALRCHPRPDARPQAD